MINQKNITQLVVGKDLDLVTSGESRADLVAGKIGVFANGLNVGKTTALVAGDTFKVTFMNVDGNIIESPEIEYSLIRNKAANDYVADTEQKTVIGFDGTSGAIEVANSSDYYIHLFRKDFSKTYGEHNLYKLVAAYKSDASATETEIADALLANAVKNLGVEKARSGVEVTKVGRLNDSTVTAANAFDNDATVVNGSKNVTVSTNLQYNTGAGTAVVGDYVRMGSVGGGTALTSSVYKIVAINSTTITLDAPVLEASGTYAAATADLEVIPSATAVAGSWGLFFESAPGKFEPGLFRYDKITFKVSLSEAFGSTPVTDLAVASKGTGTYRSVAETEWFLNGNRGETFRVAKYPVSGRTLNATVGKTYEAITLSFVNDNATSVDADVLSFITLLIYTEAESSSSVHTDLKTVFGIS